MNQNQTDEKDNKLPPKLALPSLSFASMPQFVHHPHHENNNDNNNNNHNNNNNNNNNVDVDGDFKDMNQQINDLEDFAYDIMDDYDFDDDTDNIKRGMKTEIMFSSSKKYWGAASIQGNV